MDVPAEDFLEGELVIAREWRAARWKLLVAAVPVALYISVLSPYAEFVEEARRIPSVNPVETALRDLSDSYYLGVLFVLMPLAAFLGVASISDEAGSGTLFQILSRPVSRVRMLLTKYAVGAGVLLLAAVSGKVVLTGAAAIRGYPLGEVRVVEAVTSVLVSWSGVLFVFGTAILVSTAFRSVLASAAACALTLPLVFALPHVIPALFMRSTAALGELSLRLTLFAYWVPPYYYGDPRDDTVGIGGFTTANFLVCLISAALPLLAALCLFQRKEY